MTHLTNDQVNEYVDGDLPDPGLAERHLAECEACRLEVEAIRDLVGSARALPREIDPGPELWKAVREETVDLPVRRRQTLWSMRYGLAAAAVLLAAFSSGITAAVLWTRGASAPVAVVDDRGSGAGGATLVGFQPAEAEYLRTAAELERVLEARRDRLSPETVRILEENLDIVDRAIASSREALVRDPGSAELVTMLSAVYQDKINVLESAVLLSAQS